MNNKYKIVFIDIDGTLVDNKKNVSSENIDCLKILSDKNIKIILTSARPYKSIENYAEKCGIGEVHVASNGSIVVNTKTERVIFNKSIDKKTIIEIIQNAIEQEIFFMITVDGNQFIQYEKFGISPKDRLDIKILDEDITLLLYNKNSNILKIVFLDDNKDKLLGFYNYLSKFEDISIMPIETMTIPKEIREKYGVSDNPYNLDIMAKGISKENGIHEVLKYYNIRKEDSIGIGDGLNDIDLFSGVGLKIAMKNANELLKNKADIITEYDNNNSGVAKILMNIFEIRN